MVAALRMNFNRTEEDEEDEESECMACRLSTTNDAQHIEDISIFHVSQAESRWEISKVAILCA